MVGFARAFGDGGSAYLGDVYVLSAHRGAGLGRAIVAMMIEDGPGAGFRWMLHTSDAHGLYRSFGFASPDSRYLERPAGHPGASRGRARDRRAVPGRPLTGNCAARATRPAPRAGAADRGQPGSVALSVDPGAQDEPGMRRHVEQALAARAKGIAVPFAVVRRQDETVIGATRFHRA